MKMPVPNTSVKMVVVALVDVEVVIAAAARRAGVESTAT